MQDGTGIILVNWNNYMDTIQCVYSLVRIIGDNDKILICDNASVNNSREIMYEEFYDKYNTVLLDYSFDEFDKYDLSNCKIVIINTMKNGGFGYANNVGVRYTMCINTIKYIWILNNDTVVDVNTLFFLKSNLNTNSQIGIVGSSIYEYSNKDVLYTQGGFEKNLTGIYTRKILLNKNDFLIHGFVSGACMFMKKELFIKVGGFDERYFMYVEDMDLCEKVKKEGYILSCSVKSKVYHKEGAATDKDKLKRPSDKQFIMFGYYDLRNNIYFQRKYCGNLGLLRSLYIIVRRMVGVVLYDNLKFDRIKIMLKAFKDGYKSQMGKVL